MDTTLPAYPSQVHATGATPSQPLHCSLRIFLAHRRYIPLRFRYYKQNAPSRGSNALSGKELWMNRALLATCLGALLIVTAGCKAKVDDKTAIRAGVIRYLTSLNMLNISAMDINVTQATVNGNQAQAQVEIKAKAGDAAGSSMQLNYSLEKRGEDWFVLKSQPAGGNMQHPAPGSMPPNGMPPNHPGAAGEVHNFSDIIKTTQPPAQQQQQTPPAQQSSQPAPYAKP
jgi:hypothetical protein